ncbi:helix-turn-helix domain-containing protein [Nonomuraea rhizosphaerae]|uniref:helix-turn-helix domain-containing protein n=1 Tax=Nonomuraea rhizosphaerae TaxID=2665663 RepID=UPI001C5FE7ED|nr:helix-turn-helix domain-containing protein [Nonomuraea rhizosphaerae]
MANERLRAAMLERGASLADVAAAVEVDPKTVERWVTQGRVPYRRHRFIVAGFLGMEEAYLWPEVRDQVAAVSESELVTLYPHRWAVPRDAWGHLFSSANQEIGVLVYSGLFLAEDTGIVRTFASKAKAGVRVRILFGDPKSAEVAQRGADEGIGDGMGARIMNSLVLFRPLMKLENVEIRLHGTVLYNSIYRGDDQLLINTHVYGQPASNAPVLHLRQVPGGDMVATYLESFESVWESAAPVES